MSPQYEFPIANLNTAQPQLFIRDANFLNYHINHDKWDWWREFDIIDCHRWKDDFCQALDVDNIRYDFTTVGQGETYTCTDMVNGVLLLHNGAADNDYIEVAGVCECWKLDDNYPLYAEMRFKLSDVLQSDMYFGLIQGNQWFILPNNAVVFYKLDGDASLYFQTRSGGISTNVDTGIDLVNLTWYRIGFHWDGAGNIRYFVFTDGDAPQYCVVSGVATATIPTTEMAHAFGIRNGEAAAKDMYVDYIKYVQTRVIE